VAPGVTVGAGAAALSLPMPSFASILLKNPMLLSFVGGWGGWTSRITTFCKHLLEA
jgi:hypothetical protein